MANNIDFPLYFERDKIEFSKIFFVLLGSVATVITLKAVDYKEGQLPAAYREHVPEEVISQISKRRNIWFIY